MNNRIRIRRPSGSCLSPTLVFLLFILFSPGCGKGDKDKTPPAVPVTVAEVKSETVPLYLDYVGFTASIQSVDINARVEGFLVERAFKDGADVNAGDLLFVIDPRPSDRSRNAHRSCE